VQPRALLEQRVDLMLAPAHPPMTGAAGAAGLCMGFRLVPCARAVKLRVSCEVCRGGSSGSAHRSLPVMAGLDPAIATTTVPAVSCAILTARAGGDGRV